MGVYSYDFSGDWVSVDTRHLNLISVFDVIIRYGAYYSQIQMMLIRLEDLVRPKSPSSLELPSLPPPSSSPLMDYILLGSSSLGGPLSEKKPTLLEIMNGHLAILEQEGKELNLRRTQDRINRIKNHLKSVSNTIERLGDEKMVHEIRVLREALEDDLRELRIFIPSVEQAEYHVRPKLFGEKVYTAFPSARQDILEAGNCYATDNFTACIFHLMRVSELMLRLLARHLRVDRQLKHQIDYEDWKKIADAINSKLIKLRSTRRGAKRDTAIQFYADAADRCQYFKELWRDDVMHSRRRYDAGQAKSILTRLQEFTQSLAERLGETKEKS